MYTLNFLGRALDDLRKIDRPHQKIIKEKLLILARNSLALKNKIRRIEGAKDNLYRLRVGSYRVIFKKQKDQLLIIIVRVGHRREIYFDLK